MKETKLKNLKKPKGGTEQCHPVPQSGNDFIKKPLTQKKEYLLMIHSFA